MAVKPARPPYQEPAELGDGWCSAWSSGYIPDALDVPELREARDHAARAMSIVFDAHPRQTLGEIEAKAEAEYERHRVAGRKRPQKAAREMARMAARSIRATTPFLEAIAERRHDLALGVIAALDAYRRGEVKVWKVADRVDELFDFVGWLEERDCLRERQRHPRWSPAGPKRGTGPTISEDELHDIRSAVRADWRCRRADAASRKAEGTARGDDSEFMQATICRYLEARAAGDGRPLVKLARLCADAERNSGEIDAINHANRYDFSANHAMSLPGNS